VDFANRVIRTAHAKSSAENRQIPMNTTVHSLLADLERSKDSHLVFPSDRKPGRRILDLKAGFHKAIRSAGIPHIRFHDLRHTFATRLVQAGVGIITVQHLLGHAKITPTARYAHSQSEVGWRPSINWISLRFVSHRTLIGLRAPRAREQMQGEMVLLYEHRPVAQLVRALP